MGCVPADYAGKPVIAIINTWSDLNPCHSHLRERANDVKRGVWQAGGFPVEMPAMTLGETFQKPTTMLYRNFLAMETEELLRSYPSRRLRAAWGVRQDDSGAIDGRHQYECARDLCSCWTHATWQLAGPGVGEWVRCLEILGGAARGQHRSAGLAGGRAGNRTLGRDLHDHGHGVNHDQFGGSARVLSARRQLDPRGRFEPPQDGEVRLAGASSRWYGRT